MAENEFDMNLFRPIESSLLDDAVDEYINAEIDQLAGLGESAGIDGMLDAEIDSICESNEISFNELLKICDSDSDCYSSEDKDYDDDDDDDHEDYIPSNDDYTNYSSVEVRGDDDEEDETDD